MLLAIIAVSPYRRQLLPAAFEAAYGERAASAGSRSHLRPHRARRPPHQPGGRFGPHGAVYSRIPPENPKRCPSAPFLSAAGPFRSAEPASASTAIERARERSLGRCSEPTTAPGHRATGRFRGSSGSRSTFAPATSALGPLHDPTTGYAGSPARHTLRRSVVGGSGGG